MQSLCLIRIRIIVGFFSNPDTESGSGKLVRIGRTVCRYNSKVLVPRHGKQLSEVHLNINVFKTVKMYNFLLGQYELYIYKFSKIIITKLWKLCLCPVWAIQFKLGTNYLMYWHWNSTTIYWQQYYGLEVIFFFKFHKFFLARIRSRIRKSLIRSLRSRIRIRSKIDRIRNTAENSTLGFHFLTNTDQCSNV